MINFLTVVFNGIINKDTYVSFIVALMLGLIIGALATFSYFEYTGSTFIFKKAK